MTSAVIELGLLFDLRNPPGWRRDWREHYAWHLDAVATADRLGVHSVLFSEHHFFEDGYLPQPLTFAAAVAARTRKIRIGSGILIATLHHPLQVAEEAAVIDLISGGRLDLGVGVGYRVPEFLAFGADLDRRFEVLEEHVVELRRLWRECVTPRPLQDPVPIWGGFYGPRGARMAGRLGLGLLAASDELLPPYLQGIADGGWPAEAARMRPVLDLILADDPDRAWAQIKPHLSYKWDSYRRYMVEGTGKLAPKPITPERWRAPGPDGKPPRFSVLAPEQAAQHIRERFGGLPVVEVVLWGTLPGLQVDLAERHLELAATALMPALRTNGTGREDSSGPDPTKRRPVPEMPGY